MANSNQLAHSDAEHEVNYSLQDLDDLEQSLSDEMEEQLSELDFLKKEREKIGSPDGLGETVMNVVWEQFMNQIGAVAGEDFIRENRGLSLDLRDSAHIQTSENFKEGKIAKHNSISADQLHANYDRYENTKHGEFRREYVNKGMDSTLERAGSLNKKGVEYVKDIYTGRMIPTQTKLENGKNNPLAAQREHVIASAKLYEDASLQMAKTNEELAATINNPENLQGYTTAERNNRKSDNSAEDMESRDKNRHWEKANERAENFVNEEKKKGEERLKQEGRKTQMAEAKNMGKHALRTVALTLLAKMTKEIFQQFIGWLRSKQKSFSSFISGMKQAVHRFFSDIKSHIKDAAYSASVSILGMIFGPITRLLTKTWTFLKQGYKSLKQAINYLRDPKNKCKPVGILMAEVGKIVVAGLTAAGAIALGGVIEGALSHVPFLAFEIPLIGSLASVLGMLLGAIVSGIIGALILRLIDKYIAKKLKAANEKQTIAKRTDILHTQAKQVAVGMAKASAVKTASAIEIGKRHQEAHAAVSEKIDMIHDESYKHEIRDTETSRNLKSLLSDIEAI